MFSGADIGECGSATDAGTKEGPHHAKTSVAPSLETLQGKMSSWTGAFYSHISIFTHIQSLVFFKQIQLTVVTTDLGLPWYNS